MKKILPYLLFLLLTATPVRARVDTKKVPFHGTEEEWKKYKENAKKIRVYLSLFLSLEELLALDY